MRALLWSSFVVLSLLGCQAGIVPGAQCARPSDCPAPLTCAFGRCRSECAETRDCPLGAECLLDAAGVGACALPMHDTCDLVSLPCVDGLVCAGTTCRQPCDHLPCAPGATCQNVTAVDVCIADGVDAGPQVDAGARDTGASQSDVGTGLDAGSPVGGIAAPTAVAEVVSLTGGSFGGYAVDDSGALILAVTQTTGTVLGLAPPASGTRVSVVRYAGASATPLVTWTATGTAAAATVGVRTRGTSAYVCASVQRSLTGPPSVTVPTGDAVLLLARMDAMTGALAWSGVLSLAGSTIQCSDFEVLDDGSLVVATRISPVVTTPQALVWNGTAVPDALLGGLGAVTDGSGGDVLTLRVVDRVDHADIAHGRFYAQVNVSMLVESLGMGYAVSAYTGRSLDVDWGTDVAVHNFGGSATDVGIARYVLDAADPTGERVVMGGSPFSVTYSSGQSPPNVVALGSRVFVVSAASRNTTYSSWGIWGCLTDTALPGAGRLAVTYAFELDATNACIASTHRAEQVHASTLDTRAASANDLLVYGGLSLTETAQPVMLFGAPPLSFSETTLAFLADLDADLVPRWHVEITGAPGTIRVARAVPGGHALWVRGNVTGTGMLLGMPVSGDFLARLTVP